VSLDTMRGVLTMSEMNTDKNGIEKSIDDYLKAGGDGASFATGWVLVVSMSSPAYSQDDGDGYVTIASDGLPHHVQVGLMSVAIEDKRNIGLISTVRSYLGAAGIDLTDGEWEDE